MNDLFDFIAESYNVGIDKKKQATRETQHMLCVMLVNPKGIVQKDSRDSIFCVQKILF